MCVAAAGPAAAHNPVPGLEGFYAGLRHPITTPDQLLALLATGFLLGGFALFRLLPAFAALGAGLLGGLALGHVAGSPAAWLYTFAGASAATAALAPGRWLAATILVGGAAGLLLGWASVPGPGPAQDRIVTMAGSVVGALLVTLYVAGLLDYVQERVDRPTLRIAMRVAAAWLAAIAVLMLALSVGPQAAGALP